jgi:hypothetical protein
VSLDPPVHLRAANNSAISDAFTIIVLPKVVAARPTTGQCLIFVRGERCSMFLPLHCTRALLLNGF